MSARRIANLDALQSDDSEDEVPRAVNKQSDEESRPITKQILDSDSEEEDEEVHKSDEENSDKASNPRSADGSPENKKFKKTNKPIIREDDEDDDEDDDDEDDEGEKDKAKGRKGASSKEEDEEEQVTKANDPDNGSKSDEDEEGDEKESKKDQDSEDEDSEEEDEDNDDDDLSEDGAKEGKREKNKKSKKDLVDGDKEGSERSEESDDDIISEEDDRQERPPQQMSDFDIMMAKKKEENSRKRKRRNYDIINDNDDIIADIINQMRDAMEADREANENRKAATQKLNLLPFVINQLRKVDLRDAFLDSDVLSIITEWLAPLPDRSLPHLNIRESLLKVLIDFNLYDVDRIKSSGIGKAVMYLYKHPKETKENKQRAKQLISCWSRPIFQLDSSFNAISREEREQRDLDLMNKQRRSSGHNDSESESGPSTSNRPRSGNKEETGPTAHKPGDKGWIPRARVPAPSMRDYVIRPRSKVDGDIGKNMRRPANMLEKYMKSQQERKRASRQQRAVNMKIDRV